MKKYKYYFRKPRSAIAKDVLKTLALAGIIAVAATSPYSSTLFWKAFKQRKTFQKRRVMDTFTRLRRNGCIHIEQTGHEIRISLTAKGKELAGYMQIDDLSIPQPKQWDRQWRLI